MVTFSSDFGTREYYVGAVKGVILSTNPEIQLVDLSHDIPSHDVLAGAFSIAGSYACFPSGTIHLVVVDPGVGSERRGLVASTEKHLFVAPDNGVLSMVFAREKVSRVVSIEAEHYFRRPVSPTFHARDIFAPVVGWLSKGVDISKFGPEIEDFRNLALPQLRTGEGGVLEGLVLHVDKFGNVITSLTPESIAGSGIVLGQCALSVGERTVDRLVSYYAEGSEGEPFYLVGSSGFIEIAVQKQSAASVLGVRRGARVLLTPR